jgi:hypothetical protein
MSVWRCEYDLKEFVDREAKRNQRDCGRYAGGRDRSSEGFLGERHQLPMVFDLSSSPRRVFAQLDAAFWASLALETRLDNWKLPVVRAW